MQQAIPVALFGWAGSSLGEHRTHVTDNVLKRKEATREMTRQERVVVRVVANDVGGAGLLNGESTSYRHGTPAKIRRLVGRRLSIVHIDQIKIDRLVQRHRRRHRHRSVAALIVNNLIHDGAPPVAATTRKATRDKAAATTAAHAIPDRARPAIQNNVIPDREAPSSDLIIVEARRTIVKQKDGKIRDVALMSTRTSANDPNFIEARLSILISGMM